MIGKKKIHWKAMCKRKFLIGLKNYF
ncbi:hypothetical protein Slin_4402 [Spirosoma linguale DSM 74]|uniref:Uncharacterized protein n=1 Tax=Spirosoma linguale (strain ATCC 33905 / DSM 74 / LMG 10896 / Claus 1) TaxID=504472 RepID=D2QLU3_SPILD|nr:hypothetical protein Slin_4402 [Spirosoma linguale DSM 74]